MLCCIAGKNKGDPEAAATDGDDKRSATGTPPGDQSQQTNSRLESSDKDSMSSNLSPSSSINSVGMDDATITTTTTMTTPKLDPVSQAVYDNMLGRLPTKRKLEIPCSSCEMKFSSKVQAEQHFKGVRHAKRLKMIEEFGTAKPNAQREKRQTNGGINGIIKTGIYSNYNAITVSN